MRHFGKAGILLPRGGYTSVCLNTSARFKEGIWRKKKNNCGATIATALLKTSPTFEFQLHNDTTFPTAAPASCPRCMNKRSHHPPLITMNSFEPYLYRQYACSRSEAPQLEKRNTSVRVPRDIPLQYRGLWVSLASLLGFPCGPVSQSWV